MVILAMSIITRIFVISYLAVFKASDNSEYIKGLETRLSEMTTQELTLQTDKEKLTSELTKEQEKTRTLQTALKEKNYEVDSDHAAY